MSGRLTVKVRFHGGDGSSSTRGWTAFRCRENELGLTKLRTLIAGAMNVSASAINYLQFQDSDGDWCTVCKDADIIEAAQEPGGLRLQVLWRGARDAIKPMQQTSPPKGAPLSIAGGSSGLLRKEQDEDTVMLTLKLARGDLEKVVAMGDLTGAIALCGRMVHAGLKPKISTFNAMLERAADRESMDDAVQIFKLLQTSGLQPDAQAYSFLMTVAIDTGDLKLAVMTLKQALKHHAEIDPAVIAECRRACRAKGLEMKDSLWIKAQPDQEVQIIAERQRQDPFKSVARGTVLGFGHQTLVPSKTSSASAGSGDVKAAKQRYLELVPLIMAGTASAKEEAEAEKIGPRHLKRTHVAHSAVCLSRVCACVCLR
jgi:pentatricopeptide repeat protein